MRDILNNPFHDFSEIVDSQSEYIPLLLPEEQERFTEENLPKQIPVLPLRNNTLFPGVLIPITVGREKSITLIKEIYKKDRLVGVFSQKNANIEDPTADDLYPIGTLAYILKILQMPDNSTTVIIQGRQKIHLDEIVETEPFLTAKISSLPIFETTIQDKDFDAVISSLKDLSIKIIKQSQNIPPESAFAIQNIENNVFLVNYIATNLNVEAHEKQKILEINDLGEMARQVLSFLTREIQVIELKNQIQNKVKIDLDKQHRDYLLNQQLKTIQEELGGTPNDEFINEIKAKAAQKKWNEDTKEIFNKELVKLQRMNSQSAEHSIQMNFLEVLVELPWNDYTTDNFDLSRAKTILDEDHFGLDKIKERIIEFLAVLKLKGDLKSPILCFVGPPGVGKTSLGKSIARALDRKYVRISLGGLRDESEIRGHRKTYIGAMPGRIIQNIRKAKSANPVFVLDEIDKILGMNINGDPAAALLEVLDPEQNNAFYDNFIETGFDLSRIMFIATANSLSTIHPALRDRMEIIELTGYTIEEKTEIALRHLVPKQLSEHGIKKSQVNVDKAVIHRIIEDYTREAGVRSLEKTIAKVIRNRAKFIATDEKYLKKVHTDELKTILGLPIFRHDKKIDNSVAGVVTGLAWTPFGGDILFIEVSLSKGKGNLTLTGNLGDVMKESATIAYEYFKAHCNTFQVSAEVFQHWNIHIHIPEGSTPKDGPSAGITMFTAIASAFTQRKVKAHIAMTGEITLRGKVLPVGGIQEKILAARNAGIHNILLPVDNERDILEIKPEYIKEMKFQYISNMIDINDLALLNTQVTQPIIFEN